LERALKRESARLAKGKSSTFTVAVTNQSLGGYTGKLKQHEVAFDGKFADGSDRAATGVSANG
jgi:hypothetical protein